jgi:phage-related protein
MAVIGHAEIVVTAITKNFEDQLKKSMGNISKSMSNRAGRAIGDGFADGFNRSNANNMFGKLSDGIRSLAPDAEMARKRFQSLVRTGYTVSAVMGLVAGAISSVVVSIGPLIGSLMRATPALLGLVNVMATLMVSMRVARSAFGDIASAVQNAVNPNNALSKTLKEVRREFKKLQFDAEEAALSVTEAELDLERAREGLARTADLAPNNRLRREAQLEVEKAELALRRAKRDAKNLAEDEAKGPKALMPEGSDPFAGLNKAQREFAEYLVTLDPKFKKVKAAMSEAFLTPLRGAVEILMDKLFPILEVRLPQIAGKVGDAMKGIAVQLSTPANAAKLDRILEKMQPSILLIGEIFGNILDIILSIVDATGELAEDVLTFLKEKTDEWAESLNKALENGDLAKFFNDAAEEAKKWFEVIGNVFGGFQNLMKLTTGPGSAGEEMLTWFKEASAEFKNMFSEDPDAGKKFFKDAMVNARAVLGAIGDFILEILKVADNPNIALAFNTLAKAAPSFGELLTSIIDAAPSFAELLVTIIDIVNLLTDDGQISAFFDTLNDGATIFKDILERPFVKKLLEDLGPLFATLSALGVIFDVIKFAATVALGYIAFSLGIISGLIKKPTAGFAGMAGAFGKMAARFAGPIGLVILAVTTLTDFYNKFEDFRGVVDATVGSILDSFGGLGEELGKLFEAIFGGSGLGGSLSSLEPIVKNVLNLIVPFVGGIITAIVDTVSTAVKFITSIVKSIRDVISPIVEGVKALLQGNLSGLVGIGLGIVNIFVGAAQGILNGIITLANTGLNIINGIITSIANSPAGQAAKKAGLDISAAKFKPIPLFDFTSAVSRGVKKFLDSQTSVKTAPKGFTSADRATRNMAMGGTVYPSEGGTIVRVAEAGRPERIEPLDSNGLSERDKALVSQLSGGGGSTINVYPSAGMDERALATEVSRQLAFQIRRGSA